MLNYLNNLDDKKSFYTPDYLYKHVTYSKSKPNHELLQFMDDVSQKMIGRLYSSNSINCISREIRFLLFSEEYVDFDIKNCHPTICLNYGETNRLGLNGSLSDYVANRENVLKIIEKELSTYYSSINLPVKLSKDRSVKKDILIIQNRKWNKYDTGSKTLNDLDDDFTVVREHLWQRYLKDEFIEYAEKVEARETLSGKKVTLQSLFFQSTETKHLFSLKGFLMAKYNSCIENRRSVKTFKDYIVDTDKEVHLSASHSLLMIPFFDGFYIKALDEKFMSELEKHVKAFNREYKKKHGIVFERKEIEPDQRYLTNCPRKQKSFSCITGFLRKKNRIALIRRFMERLPEIGKCLSKIRAFDITTDTYFEDVKQANDEIKAHFIQVCLTSGEEFNSVLDVRDYDVYNTVASRNCSECS